MTDFSALLRTLNSHSAEFILVGGVADAGFGYGYRQIYPTYVMLIPYSAFALVWGIGRIRFQPGNATTDR